MAFSRFPARFGKYIILDRVSAGGMAEVYRAKEATDEFSRVIAIKRMLDDVARDSSMVPMFVEEAKVASRLTHPNIAQIFELGRTDGALYIAMELVWGYDLKTIAKVCKEKRTVFPANIVCYLIAKAAEALDFAHNARGPDGRPLRLVHRDVSPQNIMLDYEGEVKIIDFGIAKANAKETQTVAGVIKGKFSYMAPEHMDGRPVDARSDIFALGIVLYELLSGERLFDGSSAFSIYQKVVKIPAPRVADSTAVPPELDEVVARCLAHDPDERFETAAQLVDALAPFRIQDRTIVGRREAQAFMRELFPDDEAATRERQQRYQTITDVHCVEPSHEVDPAELRRTQVFLSTELPESIRRKAPVELEGYHTEQIPLLEPATRALGPAPSPTPTQPQAELRATEKIESLPSRYALAIAIGIIALAAAAIILAARSRNMTAAELFDHLTRRTPEVAQTAPDPTATSAPAVVPDVPPTVPADAKRKQPAGGQRGKRKQRVVE